MSTVSSGAMEPLFQLIAKNVVMHREERKVSRSNQDRYWKDEQFQPRCQIAP